MNKAVTSAATLILAIGSIFLHSCSDTTTNTDVKEFIADNNTFTSFMSWPVDKTYNGPDPALGATAHANNDNTVVREVHFKDSKSPVNGKYPIGTLVVKHSHNPAGTVNEFTAMVKRGNNFNPEVGDWEFFVLTPTGAIATDSKGAALRGANLLDGLCSGCHSGASEKDFVFSK